MSRIKKGFTLVELLCTIVILLLVSAAVNVGIHLAVQNYASSITNSEAHVLCGTVGDLVCDELRFGSNLTWTDFHQPEYRQPEVCGGRRSGISELQ